MVESLELFRVGCIRGEEDELLCKEDDEYEKEDVDGNERVEWTFPVPFTEYILFPFTHLTF